MSAKASLFLTLYSLAAPAAAGTIDALNLLQATPLSGSRLGCFYDASAARLDPPPKPARRPARVHLPREPFVVDVPKAPQTSDTRIIRRLMAKPKKISGYDALIRSNAARHGLDPRLVKAVIAAESEFTARAKSPTGALGLMQLMPDTANEVGVSSKLLFDPASNIRAGTAYLAHLFARAWKRYHLKGVSYSRAPQWVLQRIIAAYNAGPRFLTQRRLYQETRQYIRKVLIFYRSALTDLRAS
jgi:soluble lytic murein transglycosylase-like protein